MREFSTSSGESGGGTGERKKSPLHAAPAAGDASRADDAEVAAPLYIRDAQMV